MWGDCQVCGEETRDLDCAYNQDTGQELYVCPSCAENITNDSFDEAY